MASNSPLKLSGQLLGMYIASFALTIFFAATLQQIGAPEHYVAVLMIAFLIGTWVFAGLFAKTMRLTVFHEAERAGVPFYIGQAMAAGLISSAIYILLAGEFYKNGIDGLAWFSGWVLGATMLGVLVAPGYASSRAVTLPEMFFGRDENRLFRFASLVIVILSCFLLLLVQFHATAIISQQFLGIPGPIGVFAGVLAITICLLAGGIQSLSIARAMIYPVIAITFLLPLSWMSINATGLPVPQLAFGIGALQPVAEIDAEMMDAGFALGKEIFSITSDGRLDGFNFLALIICLGAGISAMPHLVQHFGVFDTRAKARRGGIWAVFFLLLVLSAVPAAAAFAKLEFYTALLGLPVSELAVESAWLFGEGTANAGKLISICGQEVVELKQVIAACGGLPEYVLTARDITISSQLLPFAAVKFAHLPDLVMTIMAAGALAALWSTADGLLLATANTLSQDGYFRLFRPKSPLGVRLFMTRFLLVLIAIITALLAAWTAPSSEFLFTAAFAISAAALFPALISKIWWSGTSSTQLFFGMLAGFTVVVLLLFLTALGADFVPNSGDEFRLPIPLLTDRLMPINSGFIGMLVAFATIGILRQISGAKKVSVTS